ncbi:MAG TPA: adenylate/guanylate cyclase domain-containing protein [Desulfobacterales bacterium]|nr:adenylate/guanylate cyclase domain-containing protein [Desulfobacterales bacterium]
MRIEKEIDRVLQSLTQAGSIQDEPDLRVIHLKTFQDVSRDIYSNTDTRTVLRNFLLLSMGYLGAIEGMIILAQRFESAARHVVHIGMGIDEASLLEQWGIQMLLRHPFSGETANRVILPDEQLPPEIALAVAFRIDDQTAGLCALGPKLVDDPYRENDRELLLTLLDNLVVALTNARSFEAVQQLNAHLEGRNTQLEADLAQLQTAIRKVELLDSIKKNLRRPVAVTVGRRRDQIPAGAMPESRVQDLSALFLSIGGYTDLWEKLGEMKTGALIEQHACVFMDAIYANNGEVNDTAGEGLMVLFLNKDQQTNALQAVQTALTIRTTTQMICNPGDDPYRPLDVNMGINSGTALVAAVRANSYSGSRRTYTARGQVTDIASRVGVLAANGSIYMTQNTASRVWGQYDLKSLGVLDQKRLSEAVDVFSL